MPRPEAERIRMGRRVMLVPKDRWEEGSKFCGVRSEREVRFDESLDMYVVYLEPPHA